MELIVFDLDGTLLNRNSIISDYTRDTLQLLGKRGIAYTVATGRTLHAARDVLIGQGFGLPHVYKNGVVIWDPKSSRFSHRNVLSSAEVSHVTQACLTEGVSPFVFTLEGNDSHAVYHPKLHGTLENDLLRLYVHDRGLRTSPLQSLPRAAEICNISAIGSSAAIENIVRFVADEEHLVAYSGEAIEGDDWYWIDIHHSNASKGGAVEVLRDLLNLERVICFGDSDNDLSMFALADESYAPANAKAHIKDAATAVIGHHDEEGIAQFLRSRFDLAST